MENGLNKILLLLTLFEPASASPRVSLVAPRAPAPAIAKKNPGAWIPQGAEGWSGMSAAV